MISSNLDIPTYDVCGYGLKNGAETIIIPDLLSGESLIYAGRIQKAACIFKANTYFVHDYEPRRSTSKETIEGDL